MKQCSVGLESWYWTLTVWKTRAMRNTPPPWLRLYLFSLLFGFSEHISIPEFVGGAKFKTETSTHMSTTVTTTVRNVDRPVSLKSKLDNETLQEEGDIKESNVDERAFIFIDNKYRLPLFNHMHHFKFEKENLNFDIGNYKAFEQSNMNSQDRTDNDPKHKEENEDHIKSYYASVQNCVISGGIDTAVANEVKDMRQKIEAVNSLMNNRFRAVPWYPKNTYPQNFNTQRLVNEGKTTVFDPKKLKHKFFFDGTSTKISNISDLIKENETEELSNEPLLSPATRKIAYNADGNENRNHQPAIYNKKYFLPPFGPADEMRSNSIDSKWEGLSFSSLFDFNGPIERSVRKLNSTTQPVLITETSTPMTKEEEKVQVHILQRNNGKMKRVPANASITQALSRRKIDI